MAPATATGAAAFGYIAFGADTLKLAADFLRNDLGNGGIFAEGVDVLATFAAKIPFVSGRIGSIVTSIVSTFGPPVADGMGK